ncbi:hypothetical protein CXG81DRAFT_20029 [Caulochytrium protostelioides]|uniref:Uncharacterized protein n=1 Tax=Caulochytrium protostelioides TaxID=1555241 RepID=A0A4V1IUB1_9FUNG|nr:hypothetical protein CXG81DRAFT_20029 [Caulochytrium protostelioides]|eukprot:RKO99938.1 hypothetical protein CXG81DRAFT_20029 [Caulochytrium protostelioides]
MARHHGLLMTLLFLLVAAMTMKAAPVGEGIPAELPLTSESRPLLRIPAELLFIRQFNILVKNGFTAKQLNVIDHNRVWARRGFNRDVLVDLEFAGRLAAGDPSKAEAEVWARAMRDAQTVLQGPSSHRIRAGVESELMAFKVLATATLMESLTDQLHVNLKRAYEKLAGPSPEDVPLRSSAATTTSSVPATGIAPLIVAPSNRRPHWARPVDVVVSADFVLDYTLLCELYGRIKAELIWEANERRGRVDPGERRRIELEELQASVRDMLSHFAEKAQLSPVARGGQLHDKSEEVSKVVPSSSRPTPSEVQQLTTSSTDDEVHNEMFPIDLNEYAEPASSSSSSRSTSPSSSRLLMKSLPQGPGWKLMWPAVQTSTAPSTAPSIDSATRPQSPATDDMTAPLAGLDSQDPDLPYADAIRKMEHYQTDVYRRASLPRSQPRVGSRIVDSNRPPLQPTTGAVWKAAGAANHAANEIIHRAGI